MMTTHKPLSDKRIALLRQRVQNYEKRIIEIAEWDDNYFFEGPLSRTQRQRIIALLQKRKAALNDMFAATNNELARLEQLNTQIATMTEQMYADLRNFYKERLRMSGMEEYDNNTYIEAQLHYNFYTEHSVLAMEEDDYYGSKFSSMLNLFNEEDGFSYPWFAYASVKFNPKDRNTDINALQGLQNPIQKKTFAIKWLQRPNTDHLPICHGLYDLIAHHLYSLPDILRMNSFAIRIECNHNRFIEC